MTILFLFFSTKQITYAEQPLKDPGRALGTYGVKDGDVVVLRQTDRRPVPTQPAFPGEMFDEYLTILGLTWLSGTVTVIKWQNHLKSANLRHAAHFATYYDFHL